MRELASSEPAYLKEVGNHSPIRRWSRRLTKLHWLDPGRLNNSFADCKNKSPPTSFVNQVRTVFPNDYVETSVGTLLQQRRQISSKCTSLFVWVSVPSLWVCERVFAYVFSPCPTPSKPNPTENVCFLPVCFALVLIPIWGLILVCCLEKDSKSWLEGWKEAPFSPAGMSLMRAISHHVSLSSTSTSSLLEKKNQTMQRNKLDFQDGILGR